MNRILAGVILSLVLAVAGLGWLYRASTKQVAELKVQTVQLKDALESEVNARAVDRTVWANRTKKATALAAQKETENAKLTKALQASATWADACVPRAVADAIGLPVDPKCQAD